MKYLHKLFTLLSLFSAFSAFGDAKRPEVTMDGSEVIFLKSEITGKDYRLYITLPGDYAENPDKSYRVMYYLDAQWDFGIVQQALGGMNYDKSINECITVGITYGGENPDYGTLRAQDYTTVKLKNDWENTGGGAEPFYQFIEKEVIPVIETEYRALSENRILAGVSYGGLFTLYTLISHPETFDAYIASTPAVIHADGDWFNKEKALKDKPKKHAQLYISVGGAESVEYKESVYRARDILQSDAYNLDVRFKEVPLLGHSGQRADTWLYSLLWLLGK